MVVTPMLRGLLGIEIGAGGRELHLKPQLPANWDRVEAQGIAAGDARYDINMVRAAGRLTITITQRRAATASALSQEVERFFVAPAFPLDANVRRVTVQGRKTQFEIVSGGDVQRALVGVEAQGPTVEMVFTYTEGTDVYLVPESLKPGAQTTGLRILRSRAEPEALHLLLEGLGGRTYALRVRTPYKIGQADGVVAAEPDGASDPRLTVAFQGPSDFYVRRELTIPLQRTASKRMK
jgi:hypothetical protein